MFPLRLLIIQRITRRIYLPVYNMLTVNGARGDLHTQ